MTKQLRTLIVLLFMAALATPVVTAAPALIPVTPGGEGETQAGAPAGDTLTLNDFASTLPHHGSATSPVGVYVRGVLALRIFAQPAANPGYVTSQPEAVSLFDLAKQYGTIGLIAHNDLAGQSFFDLAVGQHVVVIMADGSRQSYRVSSIRRLQALSPGSPYSDFVDIDANGEILSVSQLFYQVYNGYNRVVFQTCIELEGSLVWGRLFVIAESIDSFSSPDWTVKLAALMLEF